MVDNRASNVSAGGSGLFGQMADFFGVRQSQTAQGAADDLTAIDKTPVYERFNPSLNYLKTFHGKHVMVTGASGAVGTEVALQLIKAGTSRLVLFVRDDENVDPRIT